MGVDAVMLVWVPAVLSDEEVRAHGAALRLADLGGLWEEASCALDRAGWGGAAGAYTLDPPPGAGTVLEVMLITRYYGPGYERGDVAAICGTAEWLKHRFPGCVVYYGGDDSNRLTPIDLDALWKHAASRDGRAYRGVVL